MTAVKFFRSWMKLFGCILANGRATQVAQDLGSAGAVEQWEHFQTAI